MNDTPTLSEALRTAMRHWASGVAVVTSRLGEHQHGMTVSSFISVSLEPPLVLVSLAQASRTHALVRESGVFAVSLLSSEQEAVSNRFAGQIPDTEDRFAGLETAALETGAPLLVGSLAWIDCQLEQQVAAGSHSLFIGRVLAVRRFGGQPLLYYDRAYRRLA